MPVPAIQTYRNCQDKRSQGCRLFHRPYPSGKHGNGNRAFHTVLKTARQEACGCLREFQLKELVNDRWLNRNKLPERTKCLPTAVTSPSVNSLKKWICVSQIRTGHGSRRHPSGRPPVANIVFTAALNPDHFLREFYQHSPTNSFFRHCLGQRRSCVFLNIPEICFLKMIFGKLVHKFTFLIQKN